MIKGEHIKQQIVLTNLEEQRKASQKVMVTTENTGGDGIESPAEGEDLTDQNTQVSLPNLANIMSELMSPQGRSGNLLSAQTSFNNPSGGPSPRVPIPLINRPFRYN